MTRTLDAWPMTTSWRACPATAISTSTSTPASGSFKDKSVDDANVYALTALKALNHPEQVRAGQLARRSSS